MFKLTRLTTRSFHASKMPAFTLHGFPGSTNSDRVRLTLAEGGFTDFEFQIVDLLKGEHRV
jgi:glutathione S-transferase